MSESVALCLSEKMRLAPDALGLPGEQMEAQPWLSVFTRGEDMRRWLRGSRDAKEAWVASCEDVAAINLAAALKADCPQVQVRLISDEAGSGSLATRSMAADIDEVWSVRQFAEAYRARKQPAVFPLLGSASAPVKTPEENGAISPLASYSATSSRQVACENPGRRAFVLSVVSGSGGAGKSTVAALSALLLQRVGHETLLMDLDLQFGDAAELLEGARVIPFEEVMSTSFAFKGGESSSDLPTVIAAPSRLEDAEEVAPKIAGIIEQAMKRFDAIVVNTGAFWAEHHAVVLEKSSKVLFLVDQRSSSLRACRRALDLCDRCGIATTPFLFAVNRCSKKALFSSIDVSCALQGAECVELAEGGTEVEELLGAGMPDELLESKNRLCVSLERVLETLLPAIPGSKEAKGARLSRKSAKRKRFGAKKGRFDESA